MNRFEKLSLFAFKNCRIALFAGKLLAKLLAKMPLKHIDNFHRKLFLTSQLRNFLSEFQCFSKICHPHFCR